MSRPKVNAWYGWNPDKPDFRDLRYRITRPGIALLDKVDLSDGFPPCYDQGSLGSCTANAIAAALQFCQRKQKQADFTPSRLFIYYNERAMEGTINEDAGAEIRDGIKSVNIFGAPHEKLCPYIPSRFARKPTVRAFRDAKKHQSLKYQRIDNSQMQHLKAALCDGFPVVFGFSVYDSFEGAEVEKTGVINMPGKDEKMQGGHAVVCVGYDDHEGRIKVRNSWNTDWGQEGYFTMPYDYATNPDLADDFWQISLTE